MKKFRLSEMKGGWFAGDFEPSCLRTRDFEAGVKRYRAGDSEPAHVHRRLTEITVLVSGRAEINGEALAPGDIFLAEPGDEFSFRALEDCVTAVVKTPSIPGDKHPAGGGC